MRSEVASLGEAFAIGRAYEAPFFQRPYRWSRAANWEPFWAQWRAAAATGRVSFLGAVVLEPGARDDAPLRVLDGQQRLLTALVAAAALAAAARGRGADDVADRLERAMLRADGEPRMRPTRASLADLESALSGLDAAPSPEQGLRAARRFFEERLAAELAGAGDAALEAYARGLLDDTRVVLIVSGEDVDAFDLFERLNSLGEPLSALDLVKTRLFERAARSGRGEAALTALYDAHWSAFDDPERVAFWGAPERRGSETRSRQDWFLRAYLSARLRRTVSGGEIHARMADLATAGPADRGGAIADDPAAQEIADLGEAGRAFLEISGAAEPTAAADRIHALRVFAGHAVEAPLIAVRLFAWDEAGARDAALSVLESCAVRRILCGVGAAKDADVYARLANEIAPSAPGEDGLNPEKIAARLRVAGGGRFWPDNPTVRDAILERPMGARGRGPSERRRRDLVVAFLAALDDYAAAAAGRPATPRDLGAWRLVELARPADAPSDLRATLGNLTIAPSAIAEAADGVGWSAARDVLSTPGGGFLNERLAFDARFRDAFGPEEIRERGRRIADATTARWPRPR